MPLLEANSVMTAVMSLVAFISKGYMCHLSLPYNAFWGVTSGMSGKIKKSLSKAPFTHSYWLNR